MLLILILILTSSLPDNLAFQRTVCDCSSPQTMGIINIPEQRCDTQNEKPTYYPVQYTAQSKMHEFQQLNAYICASWKNIKHTTMNIFGQVITVRDKIVMETSEEECRIIYKTKKCNHESMTPDANLWTYNVEPEEQYAWMRTLIYHTIGCSAEEIKIETQEGKSTVETPLGPVPLSNTSYSHNHLIIVLENNQITTSFKQPTLMINGTGTLTQHVHKGIRILTDQEKQLSFHVLEPTNCKETLCDTYQVAGNQQITMKIKRISKSNAQQSRNQFFYLRSSFHFDISFQQQVDQHLQYIEDRAIRNENELLAASHKLKCELRKAKHQRAISTAQYNGWLAASLLQMKNCTKLNAYGKTLIAIQCKPVIAEFTTEVTKCGPQPKYNNQLHNQPRRLGVGEILPLLLDQWIRKLQ